MRYKVKSVFFLSAILLMTLVPAVINSGAHAEEVISLFGRGCEPFKKGEARSSVRVRATDKASFAAVEQIPELAEYRRQYSSHDFNVLVYAIVDNYIEDLAAKTAEQSQEKLCVEVSGYLQAENILRAINDNFQRQNQLQDNSASNVEITDESYPQKLDIEDPQSLLAVGGNILPPKPSPEINPQIANTRQKPDVAEREHLVEPIENSPAVNLFSSNDLDDSAGNVKVWISKTKFYNNTFTGKFRKELLELAEQRPGVVRATNEAEADYTIRSEVLRAKIEPLNQQTNRLQMVIAVELVTNSDKTSIKEHQNRFILFENGEDEQKVAANLMHKLLMQAATQIVKRIKVKNSGPVITPANSNYGIFIPSPRGQN